MLVFGGEGGGSLPTETFTVGSSLEWEDLPDDAKTTKYPYAATVNNEIFMQGRYLHI